MTIGGGLLVYFVTCTIELGVATMSMVVPVVVYYMLYVYFDFVIRFGLTILTGRLVYTSFLRGLSDTIFGPGFRLFAIGFLLGVVGFDNYVLWEIEGLTLAL